MAKKRKPDDAFPPGKGDYIVYTDGGCAINPGGPGGIGVIIIAPDGSKTEIRQGYISTTNNRMEMRAVITALMQIPAGSRVQLHSDSQYVINTITGGWRKKKNHDLWEMIDLFARDKDICWIWVRGHNGNQYNELCDSLASAAISATEKIADQGYYESTVNSSLRMKSRNLGGAMAIQIPDVGDSYEENMYRETMLYQSCLRGIRMFYKQASHAFRDYKELKTGGNDKFSRAGFVKLSQFLPEEHINAIRDFFPEEKDALAAARWHARGLTIQDSIRKVLVDHEISENALNLRKRRRKE